MDMASVNNGLQHFELNVESYRRRNASDKQNARRRQLPNDNHEGAATIMNN